MTTEIKTKATHQPNNSPEHQQLDVFVGKWTTEGVTKDGRTVAIRGTETYEWMPGGFFLIHNLDIRVGDDDYKAHEIIGYDTSQKIYTVNSFDSWGQRDSYQAAVQNTTWTYSGGMRRGSVVFNDDGNRMTADWQMSFDGHDWQPWMDLKSTKST
jgi:hypothetical protein